MHHVINSITKKFLQIYHASFDTIIAPPFCACCKKFLSTRAIFCIDCHEKIEPVVSVQTVLNKKYTMTVMAVSGYQDPLRSLILAKARKDILASRQMGQLIWQMTYFKHMPCDYLIPIPLHWMRFMQRGYNQAQEIAKELSHLRHVPVAPILKRTRNTPFQSALQTNKRFDNVKDAFALKITPEEQFYNKHLVLVDDLMTTGSTLACAAKILMPLKPASINTIVVSRAT